MKDICYRALKSGFCPPEGDERDDVPDCNGLEAIGAVCEGDEDYADYVCEEMDDDLDNCPNYKNGEDFYVRVHCPGASKSSKSKTSKSSWEGWSSWSSPDEPEMVVGEMLKGSSDMKSTLVVSILLVGSVVGVMFMMW